MAELAHILLADDEATFLDATSELLRKAGYVCDCAKDAMGAAELLKIKEYDLLISDIKMPGNADLKLIRDLPQIAAGLPVILVTGYPSLDTAIKAVELSIVAYLIKPLRIEVLLQNVQSALARSRSSRSIRRTRSRLQEIRQELEQLDLAFMKNGDRPTPARVGAMMPLTLRKLTECLVELQNLTDLMIVHNGKNSTNAGAAPAHKPAAIFGRMTP